MLILLTLLGALQLTLSKSLLYGNLQHLGLGCNVLFNLHFVWIVFRAVATPVRHMGKKKVWSRFVYLKIGIWRGPDTNKQNPTPNSTYRMYAYKRR